MIVDDSDEGDIIINEVDGLPGLHETTYNPDFESMLDGIDSATYEQLINDEDLPTSLIVTNVDGTLFNNDTLKVSSGSCFKKEMASASLITFMKFRN